MNLAVQVVKFKKPHLDRRGIRFKGMIRILVSSHTDKEDNIPIRPPLREKFILASVTAMIALLLRVTSFGQPPDLERKIEYILLYSDDIDTGKKYDRVAMLRQLGHADQVKSILLAMLVKYQPSKPCTKEHLLLNGAAWMAGELEQHDAIPSLRKIALDDKEEDVVREISVRSLGKVDAKGNKKVLLKILEGKQSTSFLKVAAAEALAKTEDPDVLKALQHQLSEEHDPYFRAKFEQAVKQLKETTLKSPPRS